ncbi:Rgg/GadR/MutR family transcriptional regulator [Alkalibacterium iburiense]|uniref:Rgg/GadR/MutR family transcriptional regulator n=1 Tax=Alkalibacterium iburiense TaxID=290589 RepID=A0ABN0XC53_9LACT
MESYRKVLKSLRESKDLSQYDVAKSKIVSASQISNYERETSHLTVEKFLALLDYFDTPLDIFQLLIEEPVANFREEIKLISLARERASLTELNRLKRQFESKKTSVPRYEKLLWLTEVYISSVQSKELSTEYIEKLRDYFDEEQGDDFFRVILFSNVFFLFEPEYVFPKIKRLERRMKVYTELSKEFNIEAQFYLNLINYFIMHQNYDHAEKFIQKLKIDLEGSFYIYEVEKLKFLEGKYLIKTGEKEKGRELAERAIERMQEYKWTSKAVAHQTILKGLLGN